MLVALFSIVQLAFTVNTKQQNTVFFFCVTDAKKHMGFIHNKLCIFYYQTTTNYILIKTQPKPRNQADSW
jgi:hypothetical protein